MGIPLGGKSFQVHPHISKSQMHQDRNNNNENTSKFYEITYLQDTSIADFLKDITHMHKIHCFL